MTDNRRNALTRRLAECNTLCPSCGSADLTAGDHDGGLVLTRRCRCDACGLSWTEVYAFQRAVYLKEKNE